MRIFVVKVKINSSTDKIHISGNNMLIDTVTVSHKKGKANKQLIDLLSFFQC